MHPLLERTRRLPHTLAADLRRAAELLDADAERLRAAVDARGVPQAVSAAWDSLPGRIDAAGAWLAMVVAAIVHALDRVAHRVHHVHPELLKPQRAARLARTATASTAALAVFALAAFASLAGSHDKVRIDRLAATQAPARLQALSVDDATEGNEAAATARVPAEGAVGPAVPEHPAPALAAPTIPASRGALPVGKGMWIWQPEKAEGGNAQAIVARSKATGISHLYVRTGTLKGGFIAAEFLNQLLPVAHAANIRVYGWDFPYLNDIEADTNRAAAAIAYITPDGHRIDGFSSDIELRSMGVNINNVTAFEYGRLLRAKVGPDVPLIATVPRPNPALINYPFAEIAAHFDALAPMVYWMHNEPAATVADSMARLAQFGRPVMPVGQAYDAAAEGGPLGIPPRPQILAFMNAAEKAGAPSVSWWSWQHADQQAWDAVRDAPEFMLRPASGVPFTPGQVRAWQVLLTSMGFRVPATGVFDQATAHAVSDYQRAARLPTTGVIDQATFDTLLTPFAPPIRR